MALSKEKFKGVAAKLFQKAEDGNLTIECEFELLGAYNPVSETNSPSVLETVTCIREEFTIKAKDGTLVQCNDFKLLAQYDDFTLLSPRTDSVTVTVDGVRCAIVDAPLDAANAVYEIQVRGS